MQFWWVIGVEFVGVLLFVRCTRGWAEAGRWEIDDLIASGRFTRRQVTDGRKLLLRKNPGALSADQRELALHWARYVNVWGLSSMLWSLGVFAGIELVLSGFYAFGAVGLYVLIPQALVAMYPLGLEDLFGRERRNAAKWPGVNDPDAAPLTGSPEHAPDSAPSD